MAKDAKSPELACSFCGKCEPAVKLIAAPSTIICAECVAASMEVARRREGGLQSTAGLTRTAPICNFCGRSPPDLVQPPSVLGTSAMICGECLELCRKVVSSQLEAG
jgi:ATP-dependent protease Clp ATPase subunit